MIGHTDNRCKMCRTQGLLEAPADKHRKALDADMGCHKEAGHWHGKRKCQSTMNANRVVFDRDTNDPHIEPDLKGQHLTGAHQDA